MNGSIIERLHPLQLKTASVHQDVVFKDKNGSFCYGRLLRIEGRVMEVEIGESMTQKFSPDDLFEIQSREESRREDIMLEEKEEEGREGG